MSDSQKYLYRLSEGAVLRATETYGANLQVFFPRRGEWVPYNRIEDWGQSHTITEEEALQMNAEDRADALAEATEEQG